MRFSDVFAASLVAPLVAAHGGDIPGAPKLFGAPRHMRARNPWEGHQKMHHAAAPQLQARQGGDENGQCGPSGGGKSCAAGYCCSSSGWCGIGTDYCAAPDCLINYGPGCDANKTPYGASTKNDARTQLGNIAYGGVGIRSCLKPKTVAITYDDGPYIYTQDVMDQFEKRGGRATFFVTGNNIGKGAIDENWRGVIEAMYAKGHQIASHTWSHQNLDEITKEQRFDQMIKNEMAIRNIIGKYPTYMRPPYSACVTTNCMNDMKTLGYIITSFDVDTDDYNQLTTEKIQNAKDNFRGNMTDAGPNGNGLGIAHDIHELSAHTLTEYMLEWVYSNGFTAVTVGECMNDPVKNWYRDSAAGPRPSASASASSSAPVAQPTGPPTTTGECGTAHGGQTCINFMGPDGLSECCSASGWCGRSSDHCGTGCNPSFGKCGAQPSLSASASVSVSKTSAAPAPTVSLPASDDGNCGAAALKTCKGFLLNGVKAECCSQWGYCGNSADHCGTGCNPFYGNCGSSASSSSAAASVSKTSSTAKISSTTKASSTVKSSSVSVSKSSSVSKSASSSAPASVTKTSSVSKAASSSASASVVKSSSISSSASVHKTSSVSSAASVQKTSSASVAVSVSKSASSSASQSDVKSASSTPVHTSSVSPIGQPSSTPVHTSSVSPIGQPSSTPVMKTSSASPIGQPSSSAVQASSVYPIGQSSSQVNPEPTPTKVYGESYPTTFGTVVKPTSTPCDDDKATPTPTPSAPVSKDGKCGKDNGGQTCAGYKNPFGQTIECCCKESGKCSNDPWACGVGCDAGFGKCNKY